MSKQWSELRSVQWKTGRLFIAEFLGNPPNLRSNRDTARYNPPRNLAFLDGSHRVFQTPIIAEAKAINTTVRPPTGTPVPVAAPKQPRARGAVQVSVKATQAGTGLRNLRQSGSSRAVFPRSAAHGIEAVLVNTAGGVTGGDRFETTLHAEPNTTLTLTTQAAERAYRAQTGEIGRITNHLKIDKDAQINWMPQETILFDSCALDRTLTIEMDAKARLLMVEPLVFGRAAMGERLSHCQFKDRISITRAGVPLFLDQMHITGDASAHLARAGVANGAGAMASIIYIAQDVESLLGQIRPLLSPMAGASLIRDNLLYIRALAPDSFDLRQSLVPILKTLNNNSLPRCWTL